MCHQNTAEEEEMFNPATTPATGDEENVIKKQEMKSN